MSSDIDKVIANLKNETFAQFVYGGLMAIVKKAKKKMAQDKVAKKYPVLVGKPTSRVPTVEVFGIEFEQGGAKAGVAVSKDNYYGTPGRKWNTIYSDEVNEYIMWSKYPGDGYLDIFHMPDHTFDQHFDWADAE